jgi:hypothetical protein
MDLSVNDLCDLWNIPDLLSGPRHCRQKRIDPSVRKAFRVYKGGKLKLPKKTQNCHKKIFNKNQRYADKCSVIRQELYDEVFDKELEMIVDALMQLESPNSFCPGDLESE